MGVAACGGGEQEASQPTPADLATTPTTAGAVPPTSAAPATTAPAGTLVSFDGEACTFAGPSEFELNTLPVFDIVNDSDVDFSFEVFYVEDPSWTLLDVVAIAPVLLDHSQSPDGIRVRTASGPIAPGEARSINVPFTASGRYAMGCMTLQLELENREAHITSSLVSVP